MAADAFIHLRVTPAFKAALQAAATRQQISESGLVKQLLSALMGAPTVTDPEAIAKLPPRDARLYVRLAPGDRLLLRERAGARGLAPATYVSVLVRAHLRQLVPLPKAELLALRDTTAQLGAVGRLLNQIAYQLNQGRPASSPGDPHVEAMLKVCTTLREDFRAVLVANAKSWSQG